MKIVDRVRTLFAKREMPGPSERAVKRPLREFVYLDEVSLRSLLSSQKGEMTEATSEQMVDALEAELGSSIGAQAPLIAKAEMKSRFQTSNSSTLQTSRKATVQSWFRDFHNIPNLRLIEPVGSVPAFADAEGLLRIKNHSVLIAASQLVRGELVEFRVRLTADGIFHLGTMVTEFTDLIGDSPEFFGGTETLSQLGQAQGINKILQRLLAGLIPVRAEALDHVVVTIADVEYVAHRKALVGLDLEEHPLEIVGVTEHLAYWKDIRRVLFSDAEFTMLCRVARTGLQPTWTPVKLAELFKPVTPDLVEQINDAGRDPFAGTHRTRVNVDDLRLERALNEYKDGLLVAAGKALDQDQGVQIADSIRHLYGSAGTAAKQRSAFMNVRRMLFDLVKAEVGPEKDLALRDQARKVSGLPLFPELSNARTVVIGDETEPQLKTQEPRLLDVEVVAIYW